VRAGVVNGWGKLPGPSDRRQNPVAQRWGCGLGGCETEPGSDLGHGPHLADALLAPPHVPFEAPELSLVVDGVHGICAGQDVQGGPQGSHQVTPMQSRSLIRPSRMRVLIVPSEAPAHPLPFQGGLDRLGDLVGGGEQHGSPLFPLGCGRS